MEPIDNKKINSSVFKIEHTVSIKRIQVMLEMKFDLCKIWEQLTYQLMTWQSELFVGHQLKLKPLASISLHERQSGIVEYFYL